MFSESVLMSVSVPEVWLKLPNFAFSMTNRFVTFTFRDSAKVWGIRALACWHVKDLWMKALKRREDEGVVEF